MQQTTHPAATSSAARARDFPASIATPFRPDLFPVGKAPGGTRNPRRRGFVSARSTARADYQSGPSTCPSCGSQASFQVRALTPDDTLRTLPSPIPASITPEERAWILYGSQVRLVVPNCGGPLAPWNTGLFGYSYGQDAQPVMVFPPGIQSSGQLARRSAQRTVFEEPSRIVWTDSGLLVWKPLHPCHTSAATVLGVKTFHPAHTSSPTLLGLPNTWMFST